MIKFIITAVLVTNIAIAQETRQPLYRLNESELQRSYPIDIYDPLEPLNRRIYRFNAAFDDYIFMPVVRGYRRITPKRLRRGVTNFFGNLGEIPSFINCILQGKIADSGKTAERFIINSTLGIAGIMDVATDMGVKKKREDFGQTLGFYRLGNGPFLVIPILGPSNLRDFTGRAIDFATMREIDLLRLQSKNRDWRAPVTTLKVIDLRHLQKFQYYEQGSPFEYEFVRYLYSRQRAKQIRK